VILFMTLAITLFNFYPVTAIMIIMLALLNDIPIMAIAYDNALEAPRPVRWDMREVLTIASVLGTLGVIASFVVFFVLEYMSVPRDLIQTIIFLKLDIAGHSTLYIARKRDSHFWQRPVPSTKLLVPALSTCVIGTLIACYGLFMTPIGWGWSGPVWAYASVWLMVNDFVKVGVYRVMRRRGWLVPRRVGRAGHAGA